MDSLLRQPRPPRARAAVSMPILIAMVLAVSITMAGGLLIWQGWSVARQALLDSARDSTLATGRLIDEKIHHLLTPASITIEDLARDPLIESSTLGDRLERLSALAGVFKRIPYVSASFVGYSNGDFFLIRPIRRSVPSSNAQSATTSPAGPGGAAPANAIDIEDSPPGSAYLVQSVTRGDNGQVVGKWQFYDDGMHLLGNRIVSGYLFDPRTRSWYTSAIQNSGENLTWPYVFFTTGEIGVTLSMRSARGEAVVGLDVALQDLGTQMKSLRLTPRSEIAVVGADQTAYFYHDLSRIYRRERSTVELVKLPDLGVPAFSALLATHAQNNEAESFSVDGEKWFGIATPLTSFPDRNLRVLIAIPDSDLLIAIRAGLARQVWWSLSLIAALITAGWFVGKRLGRSLTDVSRQAENLTRFDFRAPVPSDSRIREIRQLDTALGKVCVTIQNFLTTTATMGREPALDVMLERVLQQTVAATGCTRGAVYLNNEVYGGALVLAVVTDMANAPSFAPRAGTSQAGSSGMPFPSELPLSAITAGAPGGGAAAGGDSRIAVPLMSRLGSPLGLLLLDHPDDAPYEGEAFLAFVQKLSGALSSSIETRRLVEDQKNLLDGFVLLIADAIDAKSPYTGGHCRRVPELATMIVDRMMQETDGPYRDFRLTEEQRYEFHLGAWLHDCGKVTSPEHIIDKATKLEAIHNRIHEIRTRFEVLWRDAEIAHRDRLAAGDDAEASLRQRDAVQLRLQDDFAFVASCNIGGEFMTDEAIARLRDIAGQSWLRHFDDRLGLSQGEAQRIADVAVPELPVREPLLADRPEHIARWSQHRPHVEQGDPANTFGFDMKLPENAQNLGEIYNLTIRRGTLTDEDRFKINDHVVQTYVMLKSLPWPAHLARVPEIAATHHERMDGKGYPRHLTGDDLSIEQRVMALADVFEALTAADRPYKPVKTLTQSLKIMAFMCKEGHLDPEVFRYFLRSRIWDAYAERFLDPAQRDAVDLDALVAILPAGRAQVRAAV